MNTKIVNLTWAKSVEQAIQEARRGYELGADAVIVDLKFWPEAERTVETFRRVIEAVPGEWIFCLYRNDTVFGADDARRMNTLLQCAEAGASYVDVMADLYDPRPGEITFDAAAIARQREAIEAAHRFGARVIMSSHVWTTFLDDEATVNVLKAQAERGADVVKLVARSDSAEDLAGDERTLQRLQREMTVPWIRLGFGKTGHQQRFMGMKYGCAMEFARIEPPEDGVQPTIAEFIKQREILKLG